VEFEEKKMYWTTNIEGGPRRVNHASVAIGDYIYSFGGYCSGGDYKNFAPIDIHILNTNNLRWTLLQLKKNDDGTPLKYPDVPFQRYGHTAIAHKEKVYIWGGRNDEMVCDILFCFDTKTMKWSKPEVAGEYSCR
jgi:N-acetylneuraminic acid mutarotase